MKIVKYDEFIRMPQGTVFCEYEPCVFHYPFHIKTDEGDVVIDPVAGSGSTLQAAYELNRKAYGFEVDKGFYTKAIENMPCLKGD